MSIVSQLIAAFKREAEKTPPVPNPYPGGPTGGNGPDLSTADDGHEFRQPPPSVGGKPVEEIAEGGSDVTPIADIKVGSGTKVPIDRPTVGGTKAPDGPAEPGDPTPGGGEGTTTPPSAPFDPNKVIFKEVPAGGTGAGEGPRPEVRPAVKDILTSSQGPSVDADAKLNSESVNPLVVGRDRALEGAADAEHGVAVPPEGFDKLESTEIDAGRGTFKIGDIKADGIDAIQETGPAGGAGIPEGHVPVSEGAAGGAGIPEGHIPGSEGAAGGAGIPEGHVPVSEDAAGGAGPRVIDDGRAEIAGGDTPLSAEYSDEGRVRRPLTVVQTDGDGSEGGGGGPPPDPNGGGTGGSEGERISFIDRRGTLPTPQNPDAGDEGAKELRLKEGTFELEKDKIQTRIATEDHSDDDEMGRAFKSGLEKQNESIDKGMVEAGEKADVGLSRQTQNTSFGDKMVQGSGNVVSADPEEGGEVAARQIGNVKYEDTKLFDGPDGGGDVAGELAKGKAQPGNLNIPHVYDKASPVLAPDGDGPPGDPFDIKVEEVLPSSPAGVPVPYPNLAAEDSGLAEDMARKAGEGQKDFLKIGIKEAVISPEASDGVDGEATHVDHKGEIETFQRTSGPTFEERPPNLNAQESSLADDMARKAGEGQKDFLDIKLHEVLVSSANDPGDLPDVPEPDDDGLTEALARKAGKGQQDYLVVKMEDVLISSREADDGIDGESTHQDHKGEIEFARRTDVKDAHDKYANLESLAGDDDFPDDDDYESSSLLDLKPEPDVHEMLPGLAGDLPDDLDLDFDGDGDANGDGDEDVDADTDESEL